MFLFFNDTATTEIYTLSLHDALPIFEIEPILRVPASVSGSQPALTGMARSEEHTSELQSRGHLVCRLLLEKKNYKPSTRATYSSILTSIISLDVLLLYKLHFALHLTK